MGRDENSRNRAIGLFLQNPADRKVLREALAEKYRVVVADKKTPETPEWHEIDMVITDSANGVHAVSQLQTLENRPKRILIPFMMILTEEENAEPWIEIGIHDITRMPIKKSDLFLRLKILEQIADHAEKAVRKETEDFYQKIFDGAGDAILLLDAHSRAIIKANQTMQSLFGLEQEEVENYALDDLLLGNGAGNVIPPSGDSSTEFESKPKLVDCQARDSSGRVFWVGMSLMRIQIAGEDRLLAIIRDLDERRRLEDQLRQAQKMESIGQLAGGVAHDFNNILTSIVGYASILQMKLKGDQRVGDRLQRILDSSERAAKLTQGLLAYTRKQVMTRVKVDLNHFLDQYLADMKNRLNENIELVTILADDEIPVSIDRRQMAKVLENLATNAQQAMPEGGRLTFETSLVDMKDVSTKMSKSGASQLSAQIRIADSGTGMNEETCEKIFEPFFTAGKFGERQGLGLSIAHGIVKQMRGSIDCESKVGEGTTLRITLPLDK